VIAAGAWKTVSDAAEGRAVTHPWGSFAWDIPVPDPEKIICVGVNFPDRNAEYKDGQEAPPNMSLFPRFPRSFVGHEVPLTRPPESPQLDYEGEIAVIIGKGGRRIAEAEALSHIAALTLCNEGTIRDWVRHAKFNVTQGKNWDGIGRDGPLGGAVRRPRPDHWTWGWKPASTARSGRPTGRGGCCSRWRARSPISAPSPLWCRATSS
jgi:2-keto-4-pentenoate hydratase/2-oxohepta-3-ene-1,7-dioic acid hydratase in catechol pathway